jgi:hypothetical protein
MCHFLGPHVYTKIRASLDLGLKALMGKSHCKFIAFMSS